MNLQVTRDMQIGPLEERQHVFTGVALAGVVERLTGRDVQRGEQFDPR